MPRHIGILGHSADGAALCFLEAVRESARRLTPHDHPEITLSILPMAPTLPWYDQNDLDQVNRHLQKTAHRLIQAECDFFVCPDNTAHIAFEALTPANQLPLPGLHIAEVVAQTAAQNGHSKIALLGTKWTMNGPVYPAAFQRHNLSMLTPNEPQQQTIQDTIFNELCQGQITEKSQQQFINIIQDLKDQGCNAVALCCTEIPLLVTPQISPLPTLDSTRLLAQAAVQVALNQNPLPTWSGGPYNAI